MKTLLSIITVLTVFFFSCSTNVREFKFHYPVDSIQLLVADTAIFGYHNWPQHQQTNLIIPVAGEAVEFVDSTGKAAHQLMQVISFTNQERDKLLALVELLGDTEPSLSTCIHFYRHVFQCYYAGKMVGQISLDVDCQSIYIEPDKKTYAISNKSIYKKLLMLLNRKNVYLYGARL